MAAAAGALTAPTLLTTGPTATTPPAEIVAPALGSTLMATDDRLLMAIRADRSSRASLAAVEEEVDGTAKDEDAKDEDGPPEVVGSRYTTSALNVRTSPDEDARVVAVLEPGSRVKITDETRSGWRQVIQDGDARWVRAAYLASRKPKEVRTFRGLSTAPCPSSSGGSGVESGLRPAAIAVHRAVCAAFPFVSSYGGVRADSGFHGSGQAVDIMITGGGGDEIAEFVRTHAHELGVTEVIWEQKIWTTQRSSEGWRWMSDRGNPTDNHLDHVHVSTV